MKLLGLGECVCGVGERGDNRTREQGMNALPALGVTQERGVEREEVEEEEAWGHTGTVTLCVCVCVCRAVSSGLFVFTAF